MLTQKLLVESGSGRCSEQSSTVSRLAHPPWRIAFVLFKFIIGTGILSMPKSMQQTGVLLFSALLVFFGGIAWAGCILVAMSLDLIGRNSINMGQLGQVALGRAGFWLAAVVGILDCWGAVLAYFTALVGIVQPILQDSHMLGADNAFTHSTQLTIVIAALIFPLTLVRNMSSLGLLATAGSFVTFAFVAALICMAAITDGNDGHGLGNLPMARTGIQSAIAAGSIAFSYDCQVNIFANYRELDRPAGGKAVTLAKCSGVAIVGSMLIYIVTALAGYSLYGDDVEGNVLSSMPNNVGIYILKLSVFIVVVFDIPLLSYEVAAILQDHLLGHSMLANFGSNFIFISTSVVAAIYIPSMQTAFAYVGATTAVALNAILPPLFYLALTSSLAKDGRADSTTARDAYVDWQLENTPMASGATKKEPILPSSGGSLPVCGDLDMDKGDERPVGALLPVPPSDILRKFCIAYLIFGSALLPVMIVLVSKGQ